MIAETGHYLLVLALALSLLQGVAPLIGYLRHDIAVMQTATTTALAVFVCVLAGFAALVYGFAVSDFSLQVVWENSHSRQPLLYKYTSVWGNHEGSMLLWVLILALFGAIVGTFGREIGDRLRALALAVQAWICSAFLAFLLFTSNPFARLPQPPLEGRDLNPILQDIGLAIHPPLLYVGYVGFSICFSFAIAALLRGRIDAIWARYVRPWVLLAWMFLTLGIAMGSYWAYYELGWGGFWFWDPVENASLMPWLAGTALLHSALVMEKRDALKIWTILLAILTFSLSLLGTFLVRSGVLTSVHAFASDPTRGVFILAILILFIGGALLLFALRVARLAIGGTFAPISRESALIFNNLLLAAACATVFTGTLYPLALEALNGDKISVGAPFYNLTFVPLIIPIVLAAPFGPLLAWKRGDLARACGKLAAAAGLAVVIALAMAYLGYDGGLLPAAGLAAGLWLIFGAMTEPAVRAGLDRGVTARTLRRLRGLPGASWGAMLAHGGLGVSIMGIIGAVSWPTEINTVVTPGDTVPIAGYDVTFKGVQNHRGPNYEELRALFELRRAGGAMRTLTPAKRTYPARRSTTTEAAILTRGVDQLYITLGDEKDPGAYAVRLNHKPLVTLIWIGAMIMAGGGGLSFFARKRGLGAPARRKKAIAVSAAQGRHKAA